MRSIAVARLRHHAGHTVTVLHVTEHHYYADDSRQTELEWLGGKRMASAYISRALRMGFELYERLDAGGTG